MNSIFYPVNRNNSTGVSFGSKVLKKDVVELSGDAVLKKAYSKLHNITKEEYFSLTDEEKIALRSANDNLPILGTYPMDIDAFANRYAADTIKYVFDRQYGEGNYVVVSIGRSLSSIVKALEFKIGSDNVKNIPLSDVSGFYISCDSFKEYEKSINSFTNLKGFKKFKDYLSSIGLDKKTVENSNKKYIIMDFAASGNSLNGAYTILTSNEILGNKNRNITTASISDVTKLFDESLHSLISDRLYMAGFKKYSYIDNLYDDIGNVENAADYTKFASEKNIEFKKLFGFIMLDQEYSGRALPLSSELKLAQRTNTMPSQNPKVWNTTFNQYLTDVREDMQEIFKILRCVKTPVQTVNKGEKTLSVQNHNLYLDSKEKCEKLIEEKFPLQYKFYKNLKDYEKISSTLSYSLKQVSDKYFDKNLLNLEISKLFSELESKLQSLKFSTEFLSDDFSRLMCDKVVLDDFVAEIKNLYGFEKPQEAYYVFFRRDYEKIIPKLAQKYSFESVNDLVQKIKLRLSEKQIAQENKHRNFVNDFVEKVSFLHCDSNQSFLRDIIEKQNKLLENLNC